MVKKRRVTIPTTVEVSVLSKSARRCAICFGVNGDLTDKLGQIAHLDDDPSHSAEENLAFLCQEHHSVYDSPTRQHKNYTISEVKAYRDALHAAVSLGAHSRSPRGVGGKGGSATVTGTGTALGGRGGDAGVGGVGGDGGTAFVDGIGSAMGGEGGEAGQLSRGGRGGRSRLEILGHPNILLPDGTRLWDHGRGGDGAHPATDGEAQSKTPQDR